MLAQRFSRDPVELVEWLLERILPVLVALGVVLGRPAVVLAQNSDAQQWAFLVGIEGYKKANPLRHTVNDMRQLKNALCARGNYSAVNVAEFVDSKDESIQPTKANLMAALPAFLGKPGPEDLVLIAFSGHGFRDKDGKLYLAPIDCDPANASATGIPVEWLREQLAKCRAKTKLLILDACHAGSEKGEEETAGVGSKDLGSSFRDLEGVVTIASSTGDQKSWVWDERDQSLFSYWLVRGLRGLADVDGDGAVTIDELYGFVHRNVTETAKLRFPKPQEPVRIVRSGTLGVPVVVRLKPQPLEQVLSDLAEQMAWSMEVRKLSKVGVLEFTGDSALGELLGADFGQLGRYCAEKLERQLMARSGGKFGVVDRRRLQNALKTKNFSVNDLGDGKAIKALADQTGGMPCLTVGTLRNRTGRIMGVDCKMLQTDRDEMAASTNSVVALNESEWAMIGKSIAVSPSDRIVRWRAGVEQADPEEQAIRKWDDRAKGMHPLKDSNFPYRVKIMVKRGGRGPLREAPIVFRDNDAYVGMQPGDVYEVWIDNQTRDDVCMRLLVDGLNTCAEPAVSKMMVVEAKPEKPEPKPGPTQWVTGMRVSLNDAAHWILTPERTAKICGFFTSQEENSSYLEFTVSDAQQSLAARQNFTDQIGLITAAFYAKGGTSRKIGTDTGREENQTLAYREAAVGNLLAVVHIKYVEPEALTRNR